MLINLILNFALVFVAYHKRTLTLSGSVTAFVVGFLFYYLGGFGSWLLLILFFLSSAVIGRVKKRKKWLDNADNVAPELNGRRAVQVLANSLPALVCLASFYFTGDSFYYFATVATIAGATADTWGSEIGIVSQKVPVSILNFQPIKAGLSGGVSLLGTVSSFAGAFFIASIAWLLSFSGELSFSLGSFALLCILGFSSSIIDSLLGATIQEKFYIEGTIITEVRPTNGEKSVSFSGILGVDNNMVNFLSGIFTGILSVLVFALFL